MLAHQPRAAPHEQHNPHHRPQRGAAHREGSQTWALPSRDSAHVVEPHGGGWLSTLDAEQIGGSTNILELHRIVQRARVEGRSDLQQAAEARLRAFSARAERRDEDVGSRVGEEVDDSWRDALDRSRGAESTWRGGGPSSFPEAPQTSTALSNEASHSFVQRSTAHPLVSPLAVAATRHAERAAQLDMYASRYLTPLEKTREGYLPPPHPSMDQSRPSTAEAAAGRRQLPRHRLLGRFGFGSTSPQRPGDKEPAQDSGVLPIGPGMLRPGVAGAQVAPLGVAEELFRPSSPEWDGAEAEAAAIMGYATRAAAGERAGGSGLPLAEGSDLTMPVDFRGARRLIPKHVIKRAQEPVWQAPPPQREVLADERSLAFFHGKSTTTLGCVAPISQTVCVDRRDDGGGEGGGGNAGGAHRAAGGEAPGVGQRDEGPGRGGLRPAAGYGAGAGAGARAAAGARRSAGWQEEVTHDIGQELLRGACTLSGGFSWLTADLTIA